MKAVIQVRNSGRVLKAAALYFALVFGAGFVLGTIRVLLVVPHLGLRNAELLEQPVMLVAVFIAAGWIVRRRTWALTRIETLVVGLIALSVLVTAEILVALLLQPNRPRDTVSGVVYLTMLGLFALMPWLVSRKERSNKENSFA